MTTKDEALKLALEALECVTGHFTRTPSTLRDSEVRGEAHKAITAIREALAEQPAVSAGPITPAMMQGPTPEQKSQMVAAMSKLAEQPAQQEPVAWLKVTEHWLSGMPKLEIAKPQERGAKPVYLNPYQLT